MDRRLGLLDRGEQRLAGDEPRAAAVGEEAERPAGHHDDPVREPDEIDDVDAQPEQPGGEAALLPERAEPRDVGHAGEPADDRHVAVVAVAERLGRAAEDAPADRAWPRGCRPASRPGRRPASLAPASTAAPPHRRRRRSRDGRGSVRSGLDEHPPVAVGLGAGRGRDPPRERRGHRPRRPTARSVPGWRRSSRRPPPPSGRHAVLVDVGDPGAQPDLDAEPLELALRRRATGRAGRSAGSGPSPRRG